MEQTKASKIKQLLGKKGLSEKATKSIKDKVKFLETNQTITK
ncbi:unnamed protein product [marine sediment metagenome]|uniref:Uncharacterized protein n=1 Tax=marine sediment metagenome TaxID=412755 RepID=X0UTM2_9ZZZZ